MPNVRLPPTATIGAPDLRVQSGDRELLLRHARADQRESSIAGFHRGFMRVNDDVMDTAS